MRRTHALAATGALFAIGLLAVLLATLTSSTLTATTVLAGVAIVIAIGECAQFIVLGTIVADLAPPHLLGRYMSLYGLGFTGRRGPGSRGRRRAARNVTRRRLVGRRLGGSTDRSRLATIGDRIPEPCSCRRNALRRKPSARPMDSATTAR